MVQEYLHKAIEGEDLTLEEARSAADAVFEDATDAQIGALLVALRMKGETEEEIAGFAQGMKNAARTISPDASPLIDTCGTGGDGYDTINVSTASAIVASAGGAVVAKHGNYSVSSSSGSADVLEELGVEIDAEPPAVERAIEEAGVGFMLAPVFHPAMKRVIGPRKELGARTVFNVLGPLTNPAGAESQVVGVYDAELVPLMARSLAHMDVERALVVHGAGMDEIALHGETTVAEVDGESVEEYAVTPDEIGLEEAPVEDVAGGTPQENARHLRRIFEGDETGAKRDIVLANSGAALYVAGVASSVEEGVEVARNAIEEGRAAEKLRALAETQ
ncbi:MAG: anthranilate phosphoribosyltransferase [Halobacteriales archaeon]|nr:anthranilate phosphoribosyltransferase [Halobacteriales archaeon]